MKAHAWRIAKDCHVIATPEGPIVANKGDIIMVVVRPSWEQMACVMANLDQSPEPKSG